MFTRLGRNDSSIHPIEYPLNRISYLPDSIVQKILCRLRAHEDAVRMSFVSKTWQTLWSSLPAYHFDFNSDTGQPISYYYQAGPYPKRKRSAATAHRCAYHFDFNSDTGQPISYYYQAGPYPKRKRSAATALDESLRMLHEYDDDQKKIINYFRLRGRVPLQSQAWNVDRWIKLVTKHFVKELHLRFSYVAGVPRYRFPPASFDVGSLVVLSLSHCVLDQALVQEGRRFCCLKELSFSYVDLNGLVTDLLSRCPSLETLEFYRCENTQHTQLGDLTKPIKTDLKFENIQDSIGEKTGCCDDTWKDKDHLRKAEDIFRVLKSKKFALLLDDIWERIDLAKIGVPIPDRQNKSKLVFTTRSEEVCSRMSAHKKIKVECLVWDRAWTLFQEKVGEETLYIHPDIPKLAEIVAKECDGLPLALITIGWAMACKKTPQEWNHAIQVLKRSASEFSGMGGDEVFPLLKFSYDNLPSEKVRSCFLYCALFPEDFLIHKRRLIYCWVGEEILDEYDDITGAQNQGYDIIGTLVNACLLEGREDYVRMHDVIRDMAMWLVCECGKVKENFLVHTGAHLIEAPDFEKWKGV
ncbi:hypothetical protein ACE6H2_009941 [Prunus campanulata]